MPIITLTTDFGTRDGYVGQMKGVIARLAPEAMLVDITHDVPRHDIAHAAWVVATTCRRFPNGTVHVVVVDPGVGGARRGVIVRTHGQIYVGPDNGVFAYLEADKGYEIGVPADASPTFHGRDVFAPAAAALARGEGLSDQLVQLAGALPWGPRAFGTGRVVHVDLFGNLVTDLPATELTRAVSIGGRIVHVGTTYEAVARGELVAYVGSSGTAEIAVREGRADDALRAERGLEVVSVQG